MPQIFHRSMNTFSRVSIFGAVFIVAGAILLGAVVARSPYTTQVGVVRLQPIPFSHEHHVGQMGIDCRYCHWTVETSASAGMPTTEICLNCHSQLFADSEMLAPLRQSLREGEPLHWARLHDLPDFAYFNHAIHVEKGVACETCHGRVDGMPLMWRTETLHMEWCLECHRNPHQNIRPREAVFQMGFAPPEDRDEDPAETTGREPIGIKTDCSVCHR